MGRRYGEKRPTIIEDIVPADRHRTMSMAVKQSAGVLFPKTTSPLSPPIIEEEQLRDRRAESFVSFAGPTSSTSQEQDF